MVFDLLSFCCGLRCLVSRRFTRRAQVAQFANKHVFFGVPGLLSIVCIRIDPLAPRGALARDRFRLAGLRCGIILRRDGRELRGWGTIYLQAGRHGCSGGTWLATKHLVKTPEGSTLLAGALVRSKGWRLDLRTLQNIYRIHTRHYQ